MHRAYSYRVEGPPGATLRFINICVKWFYSAWNSSALYLQLCKVKGHAEVKRIFAAHTHCQWMAQRRSSKCLNTAHCNNVEGQRSRKGREYIRRGGPTGSDVAYNTEFLVPRPLPHCGRDLVTRLETLTTRVKTACVSS